MPKAGQAGNGTKPHVASSTAKLKWLSEYMKENHRANVMDAHLVNAFSETFNADVKVMLYGADRCKELGKLLSLGYKKGLFKRNAVGLSGGGWHDGFPKWVYVYELCQ